MGDKFVQYMEVVGVFFWFGEDQWQYLCFVVGMYQNIQQVEQFFGSVDVVWENNDFVGDMYEGFQMFFDIWYDDQFIDQWVWWFCSDNGWFGYVDKVVVFVVLLCMVDSGVFYWCFYCVRFVVGVDIQFLQVQLCIDVVGVEIFVFVDGVVVLVDDYVWCFVDVQCVGVVQD